MPSFPLAGPSGSGLDVTSLINSGPDPAQRNAHIHPPGANPPTLALSPHLSSVSPPALFAFL